MCRTNHRGSSRGFSLVEVMVALAIGVLLSIGLVQVFSAQRATFAANEGLARVQESSRFAMAFLQRDLRMTGNMTCLNDMGFAGRLYNHLSPAGPELAPWLYRIDRPLQVYEYIGTAPGDTFPLAEDRTTPGADAWNPPLPIELGIDAEALDGSDVLVMRYMSTDATRLTGIGVNAATGTLTAADPAFLQKGRVYGVTDCRNFSLFQSQGGNAIGVGGLNQVGFTGHENNYGPEVPLYRLEFVAYYVGASVDGGPALFRTSFDQDGGLQSEEVVPGVESLQAVLGSDTTLRANGDQPSRYLTADRVQDGGGDWPMSTDTQRWNAVVSVRLGVLVRNETRAAADAPAKARRVADTLLGTPDDARPRHVYEAQVALRNRIRG